MLRRIAPFLCVLAVLFGPARLAVGLTGEVAVQRECAEESCVHRSSTDARDGKDPCTHADACGQGASRAQCGCGMFVVSTPESSPVGSSPPVRLIGGTGGDEGRLSPDRFFRPPRGG